MEEKKEAPIKRKPGRPKLSTSSVKPVKEVLSDAQDAEEIARPKRNRKRPAKEADFCMYEDLQEDQRLFFLEAAAASKLSANVESDKDEELTPEDVAKKKLVKTKRMDAVEEVSVKTEMDEDVKLDDAPVVVKKPRGRPKGSLGKKERKTEEKAEIVKKVLDQPQALDSSEDASSEFSVQVNNNSFSTKNNLDSTQQEETSVKKDQDDPQVKTEFNRSVTSTPEKQEDSKTEIIDIYLQDTKLNDGITIHTSKQNGQPILVETSNQPTKRKRGRPKKSAATATASEPKSEQAVRNKRSTYTASYYTEELSEDEEGNRKSKEKKKPGRKPRKKNSAEELEEADEGVKKRPGRKPRKNYCLEEAEDSSLYSGKHDNERPDTEWREKKNSKRKSLDESEGIAISEDLDCSSEAPPTKPRRGRPPKNRTKPKHHDSETSIHQNEKYSSDDDYLPQETKTVIPVHKRKTRERQTEICAKGPPSKSEKLLQLITQRLKKEEALKNELLEYSELPEVECGKCDFVDTGDNFLDHVLKLHNGLARPKHKHQEFTEHESRKLAGVAFAWNGCHIFCLGCKRKFSLIQHYHYHVKYSCLFKEKPAVKETCTLCGRQVHDFYMENHMKTHTEKDVVYKSFGPLEKRKAASKALLNLEMDDLVEDDTKTFKKKKDEDFETQCLNTFKSLFTKGVKGEECVEVYTCKNCAEEYCSESEVLAHVVLEHSEQVIHEDEHQKLVCHDRDRQIYLTNFTTNTGKLLSAAEKRIELIEVDDLFSDLHSFLNDWREVPEAEQQQCLPKSLLSPKLRHGSTEAWTQISRFQSHTSVYSSTLFCGGSINDVRWCPIINSKTQYLAVAVIDDIDMQISVKELAKGTSCLQIWTIPENGDPFISLLIMSDFGTAMKIEWCPSSACEIIKETERLETEGREIDRLNRLGLLAVASTDGKVRIFSVPFPEQLVRKQTGLPVWQRQPNITLIPQAYDFTETGPCLNLRWHGNKGHRLIACSYTSGLVALFDLETKSSLLKLSGNTLLPYHSFFGHLDSCTALDWIRRPFDDEFPPVLTTGGWDKNICYWSLASTDQPINRSARGRISDLKWMTPSLFGAFSCDSSYTSAFQNVYYVDMDPVIDFRKSRTLISKTMHVKCVGYSEATGALVCGDEGGQVYFTLSPLYRADIKNSLHDKKTLLSTADYIKLNESEMEKENNKFSYDTTVKEYGIEFKDDSMNILFQSSKKKNETSHGNFVLSIMRFPLISITSLDFNPNMNKLSNLATGYQSGLVRIRDLPALQNLIERTI